MDGILVVVDHSFSNVVGSFCFWMFVLLLYADLYTAKYNLHFIKFLLVQFFNYDFS